MNQKMGERMQFKELNIIDKILKALEDEGYETPTLIQEKAIPVILEGKDILGCAQTGTGKTAAFAIPTLQILNEVKKVNTAKGHIRALVITPTRELALQIYESFCTYGKYVDIKSLAIFGGVSQKPQENLLASGVDVLIATPGRLNDLMNQGIITLQDIKILVLDEADRMLDMGFITEVKRIIAKTPEKKQTLFFSATMPPEIARLASTILTKPEHIEVTPVSTTVNTINQSLYYVDKENKKRLILHILKDKSIKSVLVFTRTKYGADKLVKMLNNAKVNAKAIHGDKSQTARQDALSEFKDGQVRVLVATDIAARGIDIDGLTHVINFDLPDVAETYVHRIGRTGRAGSDGIAITFCDFDEKEMLTDIQRLIGKKIDEVIDNPFPMEQTVPSVKVPRPSNAKKNKSDNAGSEGAKKLVMTASGTLKEKKSRFNKPTKSGNGNNSKNATGTKKAEGGYKKTTNSSLKKGKDNTTKNGRKNTQGKK